MDVKEQITQLVEKLTKNEALLAQFKRDPVKTVESALGVDLPDGAVDKIVAGVKAKLTADQVSGAANALKGLFKT